MCNLVIIFESTQRGNEKRKNALIEVVQKSSWQIQEYDLNNTNQINWQDAILFLCHYTDLTKNNEVKQLFFEPNESLKRLMITYTDWIGGNESKKEAQDISKNSHKIWKVGGERLFYNLENLLTNYANSQEWDIRILNHPYNNNVQFIPALSLLCQGYLAVCEPETLEGFDTVKDLISTNLDSQKTTVQALSWWRKPFAENPEDDKELNETDLEKLNPKAQSLKDKIKEECQKKNISDIKIIEQLINAIYSNQSTIDKQDTDIVKKAYQQIKNCF